MRPFAYARPRRLDDALALLAEAPERTAVLAGGTDLLALMKDDVVRAERVVSLSGIEGLSGVEPAPDGSLRIGGGTTLTELARHPEVLRGLPALAAAAGFAAGPQIRNLGTLGGNLCQRPRCWYFRLGYGVAPVQDGVSMIRTGDNRYHAILGNRGDALFVSPSTLAPLLAALGARVRLASATGEREVAVADFFRVPGSNADREHDLRPGEVVASVVVPAREGEPMSWRTASYEVRPGKSLDWSLATAAVALRTAGDRVEEARVVLGQVAPTPWRAVQAEAVLRGAALTPETMARAAEAAVADAEPLSMNRYKIQLARVATRRALERAAAGGVP